MSDHIVVNAVTYPLSEAQACRSLLEVLRDDLQLTGTKEGCASGDCGACTVIGRCPGGEVHTLNSCIAPAGAYLGGAVLTIDAVAPAARPITSVAELHPVQRAMVAYHGAQCGFCTPGIVMSMLGAQLQTEDDAPLSRAAAAHQIGGNLCRCTGYRPILDALQAAWLDPQRPQANAAFAWLQTETQPSLGTHYQAPSDLAALTQRVCADTNPQPGYTVVAGATDLWLRYTQQYENFTCLLDVSRVAELQRIEQCGDQIRLGAAVTLARLTEFFSAEVSLPAVVETLSRFGSAQIRARGTVGGNLANASPIADLAPLLLALDAELLILARDGSQRRVPLADFYLAYKQTRLAAGEVLLRIDVTLPPRAHALQAYKISKRTEDDISSVFGAFYLDTDAAGVLRDVRIAYGGVAAYPVRLAALEAQLQDLPLATLDAPTLQRVSTAAAAHVTPISDVRASAEYRTQMVTALLGKALQRAQALYGGVPLLELHDVE